MIKMKKKNDFKKKFENFISSTPSEILFSIILFILLVLSVLSVNFWINYNANGFYGSMVYLSEYDTKVFAGDYCLELNIEKQGFEEFYDLVKIYANNEKIYEELIELNDHDCSTNRYIDSCKNKFQKRLCFDSLKLNLGENKISIETVNSNLFYEIEKFSFLENEEYNLEIKDLNTEFVTILFNTNREGFYPIEIFVNEELDHKFYPKENGEIIERINLENGDNQVKIKYKESVLENSIFFEEEFKMNYIIGIILFIFSLLVFLIFVFSKGSFVERVSLSLASEFVLILLIVFVLNFINFLSLFSFLTIFVLINFILLILFFANYNFTYVEKIDFKIDINKIFFIFVLLTAIILPMVLVYFTTTPFAYWNTFYERQSMSIVENNGLSLVDPLSYFGRDFGYSPGYFFLEAGIIWLTGLSSEAIFYLVLLIANIFLFFSIMFFAKKISLSIENSYLFYLLIWTMTFIQGFLFFSPRHSFALALLFVALGLTINKERKVIAGVILGVMALIQFPPLVAFPVIYIAITKKIEIKYLAKVLGIATLTFFMLFLNNIINFGLLTQAETSNWGYLINNSLNDILKEFWIMLIFFIIISLPFLIKKIKSKEISIFIYELKMLIFVLLGFLIQIFISYRWNIYNAIIFATLICILIPEKSLIDKNMKKILLVFFLIMNLSMFNMTASTTFTMDNLNTYNYISENVSYNERILNDPLFGHSLAFFTERKMMADLMVEYAPEEQLIDAFNFLENKDYNIINNYRIDWVLNQSRVIHRQTRGNEFIQIPLEFYELDKVYDNGVFFIHRVN